MLVIKYYLILVHFCLNHVDRFSLVILVINNEDINSHDLRLTISLVLIEGQKLHTVLLNKHILYK